MDDPEESGHERDQAAKAYLVMLMQMGYSWQQAQTQAGLCISKSTAYRLLQAVQTWGEAAVQDGRQATQVIQTIQMIQTSMEVSWESPIFIHQRLTLQLLEMVESL